jgi:ornithine cyclodeaminase/alanine dehydrogenase-like protein (mu-crystallin family)
MRDMAPQLSCAIETADNPESVVRDADLLVTVTTAKEPIFKCEWLKPGVHISAVCSHRPDLREIDGATLARAKVVVDSREAIRAECGDILLALKEKSIGENAIHAEIGEVLAGTKAARRNSDEITLYKSVGIAIQDVAAANLVYRKALEQGVGTTVEI